MITNVPALPVPKYPRGNRQPGGIQSVSASQVDDFDKCPRYWHIRSIQGLREAPDERMQLGTALHKAVENRLLKHIIPADDHPIYGKAFKRMHDAHWDELEKSVWKGRDPYAMGLMVEHKFALPTWRGGPPWNGYIDLPLHDETPNPLVVDHKSTGDLRYVKTPTELAATPQMSSYAWWALHFAGPYAKHAKLYAEDPNAGWARTPGDAVDVAHLYIRTKGKAVTQYVSVTMSFSTTQLHWKTSLGKARQMEQYSHAVSEQDLPPNVASCDHRLLGKNGCPYRTRCGFAPRTQQELPMSIPAPPAPNGAGAPSALSQSAPLTPLAAKLAAAAAARGIPTAPSAPPTPPAAAAPRPPAPPAAVPAPPTAAAVPTPPPGQVVPPDAPPRDQREDPEFQAAQAQAAADAEAARVAAEEAARAAEAAKAAKAAEKAAKAAAKAAAKVPAPPPPTPPPPVAVAVAAAETLFPPGSMAEAAVDQAVSLGFVQGAAPAAQGLVLMVDCMPTKGMPGRHMVVEDFLAPLFAQITASSGLADFRLIPYAGWKAQLAVLLQGGNYDLPDTLIVSSFATGAHEVLEALTPFASMVVRKL